ncbi:hypothetical protein GKV76_23765 [Salmonella enterica]|nr:hypothetical protein [Salmonella enterica]
MMHIFTTTRNTWLMQGLREALQEDGTDVRLHSVESAGELFCAAGSRLPPDSVLLPVFPDNHLVDCLHSLTFLCEWTRTGHPEVPCLLWGGKALIRGTEDRVPVIPWRLPPARLRGMINHGVRDEIVFQTLNAPLRGVRFILQERGSGAAVSTPCSTGDRGSPDTEN